MKRMLKTIMWWLLFILASFLLMPLCVLYSLFVYLCMGVTALMLYTCGTSWKDIKLLMADMHTDWLIKVMTWIFEKVD